ncbi:MAG: hypothetical protein KA712_04915 [Myxococcales bacterium]|nr:hypothetical protein [Myxococcales bacterium]
MKSRRFVVCALWGFVAACGGSADGRVTFTTWGESFIEEQIPSDPTGEAGFVDGWQVTFDKFLVVFAGIELADQAGRVAGTMGASLLVDHVQPGRKTLVTFSDVEARAWDRVSYRIAPPHATTTGVLTDAADLAFMSTNGYALFVEGRATKAGAAGPIEKSFRWGFSGATLYSRCTQVPEVGLPLEGVVVRAGADESVELTIHGDHFFYDRLRAAPEGSAPTGLRFEAMAAADVNADGEVTLEELNATPLDVRVYDPSGFPVTHLGPFVTSLARTVGHFQGEGECVAGAAP